MVPAFTVVAKTPTEGGGIGQLAGSVKRMADGFRDYEYFLLKISAAFPGYPG
jgi:hypothetical protein